MIEFIVSERKIPIRILPASFEIMDPAYKTTLEDMIYPMIKKGIMKSKLYIFRVSEEFLKRIVEKKDGIIESIWSKIQSLIKKFQTHAEEDQICKIISLLQ